MPLFGLGHLKTKTNRRVSHVTLYLFPVLVYKCLVNMTALSDSTVIKSTLKHMHPKMFRDKYRGARNSAISHLTTTKKYRDSLGVGGVLIDLLW